LATGIDSEGRDIRAWENVEKVVGGAIFLKDDDDVVDLGGYRV